MAYLGTFKIDDYLIIPAATHRFSSGAAYAPTSLTWTCYEDDSTAHLFENVDMVVASPFDSITGFYIYKQQLTTAAGFEKGKSYTIVIKATVDSVAAIDYHTFQIGPAPADVTQWSGTAVHTPTTAGVPMTDCHELSTQAKADVNAEVLDVLNTDTFAEPGQEAPGATITLAKKIGYLYKAFRNKVTQTSTETKLYNDDGTTVGHKSTVSDDGTTYTRGEFGTGA